MLRRPRVDDDSAERNYRVVAAEAGYLHPTYAEALRELGAPRLLPRSRGWVLERKVPGTDAVDAMGCYPLFACRDWSTLKDDLANVGTEWVSLTVVVDPFGDCTVEQLRSCFADAVVEFKQHHVADLQRPREEYVSRHHQRNVRKAMRRVTVELCENPKQLSDAWVELYRGLIRKRGIKGFSAFSKSSLEQQLAVPGLVALKATAGDRDVCILLFFVYNDVAYYHLGASSEEGYALGASHALLWAALEHFASCGLRWLNLGAGAGLHGADEDGLTRFKRGWSSETRPAWLCGRIFDRSKYEELVKAWAHSADRGYFPMYRAGELR